MTGRWLVGAACVVACSPASTAPQAPSWSPPPQVELAEPVPDASADTAVVVESGPYVCPPVADLATMVNRYWTVNPCVLDPTVAGCSTVPGYADTHTSGWRLHRVGYRTDIELRDELLLFLPPGPGNHNASILTFATVAGFRTISLGWNNQSAVERCPTTECFGLVRQEMLTGEDVSVVVEVDPADSLVGRLETLMPYLIGTDPLGGWERYWTPDTGIQWERIVVAGWSTGSGEAAYIGLKHPIDGLVSTGGPREHTGGEPADWLSEPRQVSTCAQFGAYHSYETNTELLEETYGLLGMPGPAVDADTVAAPYGGAQLVKTSAYAVGHPAWCSFHQALGMDPCMDGVALAPLYVSLFCSAADIDSCP